METPRMPKDQLVARLEDPDTLIIDVRRDREQAGAKIKNAVLEDPDSVNAWAEKYPKGKTLVLYCS
jgi:rhodanese-related sulfurtransferase